MSSDYLDLLLARQSRTAPLAEPRIGPAEAAPLTGPNWLEVVEERESLHEPANLSDGLPTDAQPLPPPRRVVSPAFEPAVIATSRVDYQDELPAPRATQPSHVPDPEKPVGVAKHATAERGDSSSSIQTTRFVTERVDAAIETRPVQSAPERMQQVFPPPTLGNAEDRLTVATPYVLPAPKDDSVKAAVQPVSIRIERVEVRGSMPVNPPPSQSRPRPRVSLEEHLKRRSARS